MALLQRLGKYTVLIEADDVFADYLIKPFTVQALSSINTVFRLLLRPIVRLQKEMGFGAAPDPQQ
jgi:hypothetical protein